MTETFSEIEMKKILENHEKTKEKHKIWVEQNKEKMKSYKLNYYNNKLKDSEKYKAYLKSDARKQICHNSYLKRKAKLQIALEQQNQLLEKQLNEQLQLNQPQAVSAGPFHLQESKTLFLSRQKQGPDSGPVALQLRTSSLQIHQQLNKPQINQQITSNQKPQINKQQQTQNNKWLYPGFYQIHQN
jgi:hypothetical protein